MEIETGEKLNLNMHTTLETRRWRYNGALRIGPGFRHMNRIRLVIPAATLKCRYDL